MDESESPSQPELPGFEASESLTSEEVERFRRLWRELRQAQGLPVHLSDPDTIAAVRRALAGQSAPRRKRRR